MVAAIADIRWELSLPWWRHQMETVSALLANCAGNSPVPDELPAQRPVTRSFDVFFYLRLSKQSSSWWFETPSCPLWRHCNVRLTSCDHNGSPWIITNKPVFGVQIYKNQCHRNTIHNYDDKSSPINFFTLGYIQSDIRSQSCSHHRRFMSLEPMLKLFIRLNTWSSSISQCNDLAGNQSKVVLIGWVRLAIIFLSYKITDCMSLAPDAT